jgi:hypothetical protein
LLERQFEVLRHAPELAAERQHVAAWLAAPPDKTLALVAQMDDLAGPEGSVVYACPMHPEVVNDEPGRCPKCGMKLLAAQLGTQPATHDRSAMQHDKHAHDRHSGEHGHVIHRRGVTDVPGLFFLGLSWQHTRGSALLGFVNDDPAYLADRIAIHQQSSPAAAAGAPRQPSG